jgi:predicted metalloprotease with PDZ domain
MESERGVSELTYSLGVLIGKGGEINDVLWDGPAFKAGLSPGMKVMAVNGKEFSGDAVKDAVTASSKDKNQPIELLVKNFDEYQTIRVNYHDGLKYPHLVRDKSKPDTLTDLIKAH